MIMEVLDKGEVLHVQFSGDYMPDRAAVYCREMANPELSGGASGFLMDMTGIIKPMRVLDAYSFVRELHNSVGKKPVALVGKKHGDAEEFCAVVGKNRGMKLETFATKEEAIAWLFCAGNGGRG